MNKEIKDIVETVKSMDKDDEEEDDDDDSDTVALAEIKSDDKSEDGD